MSDLLKAILQNYKAYITHKLYLASSMTYMYIAMVVTVPIMTVVILMKIFNLTGLIADLTIMLGILVGILLTMYVIICIWYVIISYYTSIFKIERRKREFKYIFLIWGLSFTLTYAIIFILSLPSQYLESGWLFGVGLGNVLQGLYIHDIIPLSVGITCCIVFFSLGMFSSEIASLIAFLCMLYTYMIASLVYLMLSKRALKEVMKGVKNE